MNMDKFLQKNKDNETAQQITSSQSYIAKRRFLGKLSKEAEQMIKLRELKKVEQMKKLIELKKLENNKFVIVPIQDKEIDDFIEL